MGASIKRSKIFFTVFNSVFFYLAIILTFQCYNYFKYGLEFKFSTLIATLWGTSIVYVLCTALFGFYACAKSQPNLINCLAALVGLGLLIQLALHLLLYLTVSEACPQIVQSELKTYLFHSRGKQEVHPKILEVQHGIQMLQQNLSCCGWANYKDYHLALKFLPNSCCGKYNATIFEKIAGRTVAWKPENVQTGQCSADQVNQAGCGEQFLAKFKNTFFDFNAVFILAILTYVFQVVLIVTAWKLSRQLGSTGGVFHSRFLMKEFD